LRGRELSDHEKRRAAERIWHRFLPLRLANVVKLKNRALNVSVKRSQKVSNLILNMNIYVRDASTGATIVGMSADMRGNTDESWSRTLDWLVRNRLLAPGYGLQR
jgi:uncharacterized protein YeeX (DUF496 family)